MATPITEDADKAVRLEALQGSFPPVSKHICARANLQVYITSSPGISEAQYQTQGDMMLHGTSHAFKRLYRCGFSFYNLILF